METDPFSQEVVTDLIRVRDEAGVLHVFTRESSTKEFKESFKWASIGLYARTMAAFANARGGYIFFGVTDNPRFAIGLDAAGKVAFDNLDQARLTAGLNDIFSPELHWQLGLIEVSGVTLGSIYTFESRSKPIVAKKSYQHEGANLVEGDIVYRYNSRTERAKYPEVRMMLDVARLKDQQAMMSHIEEIIKAGASNAAVLDFGRSTLQGPTGQKVLIDQDLLKQISFIREGEFNEVTGAPTLKLMGEVVPAATIAIGPERIVRTALSTEDLITDFLDQTHIGNPEEYIRQTTTGTTSFVPVHFYRQAAGLNQKQLIALVEASQTRSHSKQKLLDRLRSGDLMQLREPSSSTQYPSTIARRAFYLTLANGDVDSIKLANADQAQYFLESVKSLTDDQIAPIFDKLLEVIKECFEKYYANNARVADNLRRAACRIDIAMYGPDDPS